MTRSNPFAAPAPVAKKPAGMTKDQGEMIARVLAKETHAVIKPLTERITALEKALSYAMAEAEKAAATYLNSEDEQ